MTVKPSSPVSPESPKKKTSSPDSEKFSKLMKIEKTEAVDEEGSKSRSYQTKESKKNLPKAKQPSPYEPTFYQPPPQPSLTAISTESTSESFENPPTEEFSPHFLEGIGEETEPIQEDQSPEVLPESKTQETLKGLPARKAKGQSSPFEAVQSTERDLSLSFTEKAKTKISLGKTPKRESSALPDQKRTLPVVAKEKKENLPVPSRENGGEVALSPSAPPPSLSVKEKKEKKKDEMEPSAVLKQPEAPLTPSSTPIAKAETPSYLTPELLPLFDRMVGTLVYLNAQGIAQTQITLNSPAFASSIFFNCTVSLERYSTAPNSFNIRFIGSPEAVSLFNANIANLSTAFQKGKYSFGVGRITAEQEEFSPSRPLFRRKGGVKGEGEESSTKNEK